MQDVRVLCDKRMAYAAVGGSLYAEYAIRLPGWKGADTKSGTLTLQDARLPYGKRMAYAADGGSPYAEHAIRLLGRKDSIQK